MVVVGVVALIGAVVAVEGERSTDMRRGVAAGGYGFTQARLNSSDSKPMAVASLQQASPFPQGPSWPLPFATVPSDTKRRSKVEKKSLAANGATRRDPNVGAKPGCTARSGESGWQSS